MSRTRKGSKPPGYEFWGRRPHNIHQDKSLTCRAERRQAGIQIRADLQEAFRADCNDPTVQAAIGRVLLRYADRLADPCAVTDPTERIVGDLLTDLHEVMRSAGR